MRIRLVGVGMGASPVMTGEAREAFASAGVIIGPRRILDGLAGYAAELVALAAPDKVAAAVLAHPEWKDVCIALSGDVGFYSGARQLLQLLGQYEPELICGVSTPQYFAARLRCPWQDFHLVSAHGVRCDALAEVLNHPEVMFLTGGETAPGDIIGTLVEAGIGEAWVAVGENLSYPNERVVCGSAAELEGRAFESLSVVLVRNDKTFTRDWRCPGIDDDAFTRGKAPMTKREVRAVALSLLNPKPDAILYDVGAGTGSVAVEMALAARRGRVFAVERDPDSCRLVDANRHVFGVYNMRTVWGDAPEALAPLPPPDAAFIGGSKGRLADIVAALRAKNPDVRLVVSAIALETLSAALAAFRDLEIPDVNVCQVAANRAVARGGLHMLEARNPVFLVSGGGVPHA